MGRRNTPARRLHAVVIARFVVVLLAVIMAAAVPGPSWAAPATVGLVAPRDSRLADDLRRELGASSFVVVMVEGRAADWRQDVRRLTGPQPLHGVLVRADDQLMTVFTRNADGSVDARFEQVVGSDDRLARRRASLGVVEYLRVLTESDPAPSIDLGPLRRDDSTTRPPPPSAPVVPGGRDALAPGAGRPAAPPETSPPATPGTAGTGAGRGGAGAGAGAGAGRAKGSSALPPPSPAPASPPAPSGTVAAQAAPFAAAAATDLAKASPPSEAPAVSALGDAPPVAPRTQPWKLGAGGTFGLAAAPGGPTVHLQFLWYLPLDWRLGLCVRAFWPVLAGQFRTVGNDVRTWTFGAAMSLQYLFERATPRLQPFVGVSLGPRLGLTEATPMGALQSRETFTPSINLGAEAGLRYEMAPLVQLFLEVGLSHGWLVPGVRRLDYEAASANADAFTASFGVLFEI